MSASNSIYGIFSILIGLLFFSISTIGESENDFTILEGIIKNIPQKHIKRKRRTHFTFQIHHERLPIRNKKFSNYELYDLASLTDYEQVLKKGTFVKFHALKEDLKNKEKVKIYSLSANNEEIVRFQNRWKLMIKNLFIGSFFLIIGCFQLFAKN